MSRVASATTGRRPAYDREAAEEARQATLERMHAQLAEQVGSLDSSERWGVVAVREQLPPLQNFNNTLMIWGQRPEASMVAGYRAWQAKGRQVRRGETAIRVFGPVTAGTPKLDVHGHPVRDADGKPVQDVRIIGVKPVSVFDVLQTDGDPLPTPPQPELLTGQAPEGLWQALQGFVEAQGFTVTRGECGGANGVTRYDTREVRVRADVDDSQAVRTLAHEAAHATLHRPDQREGFACRGLVEVEAESVLVTAAHGLDASQYTFNYVAGWAHQAATPEGPSVADIVKATGQRVIGAADRILQTTQPASLAEDPVADLAVDVTRPLGRGLVADQPIGTISAATPVQARSVASALPRWERVNATHLDGAARARQQLPTAVEPAPALRR